MSVASPIVRPLFRPLFRSVFRGSAFDPLSLFANGEQGAFYLPEPQYLYQDSAGTIAVTADGDPVGYMADLSGNGNHATQTTAASKPLYRTDGTLHWLEFDGFDDYLKSDQMDLSGNNSLFSVLGVAQLSTDNASMLLEYGTSFNTIGSFYLYAPAVNTGYELSMYDGSQVREAFSGDPGPKTNVLAGLYDFSLASPNSIRSRVNGTPIAATQTGEDLTGNFSNNSLFIGARGGSLPLNGRIYGILLCTENFSQVELSESYIASKAGVTL